MKKSLYLLFLSSSLFSFVSMAQDWPATGSTFTYCVGDYAWPEMTASKITIHYSHDTIIAGKTYQISKNIDSTVDENPYYTYFTRYSNDTVYRWINDTEYLFFHFHLQFGEVITTFRSIGGTSDTACTSLLPLKVIDSTTTIINGESVTKWVLKDTLGFNIPGSEYTEYKEFWLFEKYGPSEFPWLWNRREHPGCSSPSDIGYSYLSGYNDDTTTEWDDDCPIASIEENNKEELKIIAYPNPVRDVLLIKFTESQNEPFQIQIFDVLGKLVLENNYEPNQQVELNCQKLNNGIYLYKIIQKKGAVYGNGKIIVDKL